VTVVAPADNFETREALKAAVNWPTPVYIRLGKRPMPHLHGPETSFEFGKAIILSEGADVTFVATGETVPVAVLAAEKLAESGVRCGVISMHTVKPLDEDALLTAARRSRAVVSVEEHSVHGGLGSACAEVLMQAGVHVAFKIVGIPDEYTMTGSQQEIFNYYGITPEGLAQNAAHLLAVTAPA